jgi:hypothetical protein
MTRAIAISLIVFVAGVTVPRAQQPAPGAVTGTICRGAFQFAYSERGVAQLRHREDPFNATVTTPTGTLGVTVSYKAGAATTWTDVTTRGVMTASANEGMVSYATPAGSAPLGITETYRTDGRALDWTIDLRAGNAPVTIGDLGISIPVQGPTGENPAQIFERGFLKHQFISGAGSFFFYVRASGAPPFLLVTTTPGTSLEYFSTAGRSGGTMFVHSAKSGGAETRGTSSGMAPHVAPWRQAHTSLTLKAGARQRYGFRMQWANSYDELRQQLSDNGAFDVRVTPGMTVPSDLTAKFSPH